MRKIDFTQEQLIDILDKYNNNWSQQKIANYYLVSRPVIKKILNEHEITIRERTGKYIYNQNIFEEINTNEKAYWLGFLAADGCNYQRDTNASIILSINEKDIDHLYKFQAFCETNANIITYTASDGFSQNTKMAKIVLNSKKISNDLIDKGIVPNKSLILQPPIISEDFYLPFILGYFDGDGSISKTSQYNNYSISFQGTKEMLEWICQTLEWFPRLEQRSKNNLNNYYIRCGGTNKPYQILNKLYNSCDTHLTRKFEIYKTLETVVLNRNIK